MARTNRSADERGKEALVEEVVEAFRSMRGRGMRGLQGVHRGTLSVGHLQVLLRLQLGGPLPVSRVAEWLGVSAAGATGMVGRMEERGLVERVRDEHDRRVVLVRLAPGGRKVLDEIGSRGRASLERVLLRLERIDLEQLRNGLVAFERAARRLAEEEGTADGDARDAPGAHEAGEEERGVPDAAADPE